MSISSDIETVDKTIRSRSADGGHSGTPPARRASRDNVVTTDLKNTNLFSSNRVKVVDRDFETHVVLEPVSPHPYDLSYACLLIPRFSSHHLVGDVADNLYKWLQQICLSFAWKLEYTTVRPDYFQWIMSVPATTPPSSFMQTIRQHTSRQIFEDFPRLKRENLSKDFWAPGYLVLVGTLPHSPDMIREFIRLTRQQQGILRR